MTDEEEFVRNVIQGIQGLPVGWALPVLAAATLVLAWLSWTRLPGADAGSPNLRFWATLVLCLQLAGILVLGVGGS